MEQKNGIDICNYNFHAREKKNVHTRLDDGLKFYIAQTINCLMSHIMSKMEKGAMGYIAHVSRSS